MNDKELLDEIKNATKMANELGIDGILDDINNRKIVERLRNFSVNDLKKCYVLYDMYWDDGLNDVETLSKIKQLILGENNVIL